MTDDNHYRSLDELDDAETEAKKERAEWLDLLQRNGDKVAVDLSKKLGMPVEFELKPARLRGPGHD